MAVAVMRYKSKLLLLEVHNRFYESLAPVNLVISIEIRPAKLHNCAHAVLAAGIIKLMIVHQFNQNCTKCSSASLAISGCRMQMCKSGRQQTTVFIRTSTVLYIIWYG